MSSASERESTVARLRPHSRVMFFPTVLLVSLAVGSGYGVGLVREPWQALAVLLAAAVLMVALWLVPLCRWLSRRYTITTQRVVVRSGVVVRLTQEILHSRISDVTLRRGVMQSVFRSGDVIMNAGQPSPVVLRDVRWAGLVKETLHELAEEAQRAGTDSH